MRTLLLLLLSSDLHSNLSFLISPPWTSSDPSTCYTPHSSHPWCFLRFTGAFSVSISIIFIYFVIEFTVFPCVFIIISQTFLLNSMYLTNHETASSFFYVLAFKIKNHISPAVMTQYILYFRKHLVFGDYSKNVCRNPMKDSFIFMVSFKNYYRFGFLL